MILLLAACREDAEPGAAPPDVWFNELVSDNDHGRKDEDGDHDDWVEIAAPPGANLAGWTLESELEPDAEPLVLGDGATPTDGFLLVTCDDGEGGLHAPFTLDPFGGVLALLDDSGGFVDEVRFPILRTDMSWAREADGGWTYLADPTPGAGNGL